MPFEMAYFPTNSYCETSSFIGFPHFEITIYFCQPAIVPSFFTVWEHYCFVRTSTIHTLQCLFFWLQLFSQQFVTPTSFDTPIMWSAIANVATDIIAFWPGKCLASRRRRRPKSSPRSLSRDENTQNWEAPFSEAWNCLYDSIDQERLCF